MKIAWYSNAPWGPTGYGTQTAQMLRRLRADGHELAVLANWGQQVGMGDWEGIPVYPNPHGNYGLDVVDQQARHFLDGQPGWVITLYDDWVLKDAFAGQRVASWTPVDHFPVPPKVLDWCRRHRTIAMSRYGQRELASQDVDAAYIPHGIERVFSPTPSDVRRRMRVPEDAFLVTINAANIGNVPPRKAWNENLAAMSHLMHAHEDVYLYVHSDLDRPGGVPIHGLASFYDLPTDRMRVADQDMYAWGAIPPEELARIYTASDVLLAVSMGEGFGLAVPEAMSCGTPAIVTDFTAQPELVGDTGWRVKYQTWYDPAQHAAFALPFTASIRQALGEAHAEKGSQAAQERRRAALAHAAQYDADHVYATHWRPYLAELEAELAPPARPGNTKAAKRRMRRAA